MSKRTKVMNKSNATGKTVKNTDAAANPDDSYAQTVSTGYEKRKLKKLVAQAESLIKEAERLNAPKLKRELYDIRANVLDLLGEKPKKPDHKPEMIPKGVFPPAEIFSDDKPKSKIDYDYQPRQPEPMTDEMMAT